MRRLGFAAALAAGVAGAGSARGADAQLQKMLAIKPTLGLGVEYETPAGQAAIDACKIETVTDQGRGVGYLLRDGQMKVLRKFLITNGGDKLNQWSYYQDGFEVYRESDLDGDQRLDECRWMNSAGSRIGIVQGGKVVGWKRLSAEEASKVLVQAVAAGEASLVDSVVATADELAAAGLPKDVVAKVAGDPAKRPEQVAALAAALKAGGEKAAWNKFDGTLPHALPADAASGLSKDVVLYENAMIFVSPPTPAGGQPAKLTMLQVPEMVQLGDVWKFVDLPRVVDPDKPVVASAAGIRSALYETSDGPGAAGHDEAMEAPLRALAEYDKANNAALGGDKREVAQYHLKRFPLLKAVAAAAKDADDKLNFEKQAVDSLI